MLFDKKSLDSVNDIAIFPLASQFAPNENICSFRCLSQTVATINLATDVIMHTSERSLSALEKLAVFVISRGKSKLVNQKENISSYYFAANANFCII